MVVSNKLDMFTPKFDMIQFVFCFASGFVKVVFERK